MKPNLENNPRSLEALNRAFLLNYPIEAARKLETMTAQEAGEAVGGLPVYVLQPVWENLAPGAAERLLAELEEGKAADLLVSLDAGISAGILSRFSEEERDRWLARMEPTVSKELRDLLDYPGDCAGRLMDTRINAFHGHVTVEAALDQLRKRGLERVHSLFLLDAQNRLVGQVQIERLVLAEAGELLSSLAVPIRAFVTVLDPRDEVLDKMQEARVDILPVVDGNERLAGIIYDSSVRDALKETISTNMQTMVGASKDERALSSAWFAVRKRQPWLQVNLLTAFLASAVVGMFESTIARYTALAILLPIAAGQSGNTGAQALAVTMRGLTLREITVRHWLRVTLKEMGAGLMNGLAIAITCGTCVYFWSGSVGLALIIALAMISSMTIAAVSGALVPIVLKKLGQDPALSSSIILTTVTDIAGFMSFLGIASMLSGMLEAG
ncbi:magnesium transporter [Pelagicoccus sp. SDUM812003]|uniref:magnesium transporter n=1 Tax=Pelagicoccus sp. SDUM812003 TaxID=3041267 RepID=UPI00280E8B0F|nr:magnesium transporter [Pelagicoccus sp. SDUM812003]MDQ8205504.1 magnesium transporter [Pelagicoccus sp. SDUM812003]